MASADRINGPDVRTVVEDAFDRLPRMRERARLARDLLAGKFKAPVARTVPARDRELFRQSSPQKYTASLKLLNALLRKKLVVKRFPVGESPRAQQVATKIEQPIQAVMDDLYPDAAATDLLLNEAFAAVLVSPARASWRKLHSIYEEGSETVRAKYRGKGGAAQFRAERDDWLARHIPIEIEALSCLECAPLNPQIAGTGVKVEGLAIKREFSVGYLKRRYIWGESGIVEPRTDSASSLLTLYQLVALDEDGYPYMSFCVDGKPTRFLPRTSPQDVPDDTEAVIDLSPYCAEETLPCAVGYGWCFAGVSSPDDRAVPFTSPFAKTWLGIDTLMTAKTYHGHRTGFSGWILEYDPTKLAAAGAEGFKPPQVELNPDGITPVPGHIVPNVHPGTGGDIDRLLGELDAMVKAELPGPAAFGGGQGEAGYARQVAEEDALGVFGQVREARRVLHKDTASIVFCILSKIGEIAELPVRVYANVPIPTDQGGQPSSERRIMEISPDLAGGIYELESEYQVLPGENIALRQQNYDLVQKGLLPLRRALEADGDAAPEVTQAEIEWDKLLRENPVVQAQLLDLVAKLSGDEQLQQMLEAKAQGLAAANGQPAGSFDGMVGPTQAPSLRGMAQPDQAGSLLGGIVAGQAQSGPVAASGAPGAQGPAPTPAVGGAPNA